MATFNSCSCVLENGKGSQAYSSPGKQYDLNQL